MRLIILFRTDICLKAGYSDDLGTTPPLEASVRWNKWLYDLLKPHVDELVVCNPRKNALLKDGNKSDRIDARKLAELLRGNQLKPVYHGETADRAAIKRYMHMVQAAPGTPNHVPVSDTLTTSAAVGRVK